MPAVEYRPLEGLTPKQAQRLYHTFINELRIAQAFSVGPSAHDHTIGQGIMALLNEAETMGLCTLLHPERNDDGGTTGDPAPEPDRD